MRVSPSWWFSCFTLALLLPPAAAQSGWSRDYDTPGFGVGGRVFATGTWNNELVVGTYKVVNQDGVTLSHVGRYDGVRWRALGAGVDGPVRCVLEFGGELYIGGDFRASGRRAVRSIARWDGNGFVPVGAGLDGTVWDLCEHGGALIAVGSFTSSGGASTGQVARFDGTAWQPLGRTTFAGLGTPAAYCAVSDGNRLFVGGAFTAVDGVPASHLAQWRSGAWSGVGGGFNAFSYGTVWDLALHGGRLFAAGSFDSAGGVSADDVAAWDGQRWASLGPGLSNQIYGSDARSLCVFGGDVYVGGSFNVLGASTAVHRIVRYDGQTLRPVGGATDAEVNPATIFAMTAWNNRLYCGGEFQGVVQPGASPLQANAAYHIASFDGVRWSALGRGDLGLEADATTLGWWRGQRLVGGYMNYAGTARVAGLGYFEGEDWRQLGAFDGVVLQTLEHLGDLWVVGQFRKVDGITVNGVARYDGTRWHSLANGPNLSGCSAIAVYRNEIVVGSVSNPLRWTGTAWQKLGAPIFGTIHALQVHNRLLYVGGYTPFTQGSPHLFQWDGAALTVVGGGTNGSVAALTTFGGELVLAGSFTRAGSVAADHIATWDGQRFREIGGGLPGPQGSRVTALATFDGQLVAGGDLHINGADYVTRWNGAQWEELPGGSPNGFVSALLADDARGELHVAGWFNRIAGMPSMNYGVWHRSLPWRDIGFALPSPRRAPFLGVTSTFVEGQPLHFDLSSMQEGAAFALGLGTQRTAIPFFGGTLVSSFDLGAVVGVADGIGASHLALRWPALASGFTAHAQAWCLDGSMPAGLTATNGVTLRQP